MLEKAERDLQRRLRHAERLQGDGDETFTMAQLRVTLIQVEAVLKEVKAGMKSLLLDVQPDVSAAATTGAVEYLRASEKRFKGVGERLPLNEAMMLDRASRGSKSSLLHRLEGDSKAGPGILERYGDATIERFEQELQQRFVAKKSWGDTRARLVEASPFLQQAPGSWAERIVRTEVMGVHGAAAWEAGRDANQQLGDMVKILSATFDNRTAADSYAVHGQIRKLDQAFGSWNGPHMYPPQRPNDREVVVNHRISWPIPPELAWKSEGEIAGRWAKEKRSGAMPARPAMTTVPLDQFGTNARG